MAGQILNAAVELEEFRYVRIAWIESRLAKVPLRRVLWIRPLPSVDKLRKARECIRREAKGFTYIANGRTAAIGNDVGGHGRAQFAVTLVHVLDDTLTLFAARQIEIDIGPLAALFGEK